MDAHIPALDDHCQIQIFVQSLGRKHATTFNNILGRLRKIETLEISDNPRRFIRPCFVTEVNKDLKKFGDLQAHRKIFGFLGVACVPTSKGEADAMAALGAARASYDTAKEKLHDSLLNGKCVTVGMPELSRTFFDANDLVPIESIEESGDFEQQIFDFLRSIFFILESRRLDNSFESVEQPQCPLLPDEERYQIGIKGKQGKSYRKKCLGRLRKQSADYAMLSGLPSIALDQYHSAAEQLKSAGDLLWLAAAYEGWSTTSLILLLQQQSMTNERPDEQYKKIVSKLKLALENYERYSFAAFVELECVLKTALVFKQQRMFIETESFLRDHVGKYLDDDFSFFNNLIKAQVCMTSAEIFKSIGFIRKHAFYARLAVLFRLHVSVNEQKTEADYRIVYPILYSTLPGYGIQINDSTCSFTSSKGHVSIQVKTLHEVFMSAQRAGYTEAAIRHLCYMIQVYFFHIDDANKMQLIDELKRLVRLHLKKFDRISLVQPLTIENCPVILPPIQMTHFPQITNFRIQPLTPNLAPTILPPADQAQADVFIYSPFQERDRVKKVLWVVDNVCQVNIQVQNLLPTELIVHSLVLHTEGCNFEAVPVRLNLAAASHPSASIAHIPLLGQAPAQPAQQQQNNNGQRNAANDNEAAEVPEQPTSSSTEISLLGVPRSPGTLRVTGYSCVVFDMENRCYLREQQNALVGQPKQELTVQVLPALPKLQLQTSLKRAPVVDDEAGGIGEATIFSGQTAIHTITMQNADKHTAIKWIQCRVVDQPAGFGGPQLIELVVDDEFEENHQSEEDLEEDEKLIAEDTRKISQNGLRFGRLRPTQRRQIRLRIFGVDPASTQSAQETQVFVRKHQRSNTTIIEEDNRRTRSEQLKARRSKTDLEPNRKNEKSKVEEIDDEEADEDQRLLERQDSTTSAPILSPAMARVSPHSTHDLIPYTGRLLTASIEFTYAADIQTENGETYERSEKLFLAATIVPALTVIDWQVIAGDSPATRFVVVDVTNLCDSEAELTFGADQRMINVQSRELCRVPLLCPCSTQIHAADFQQAAQRASHMMQMQEMEQLRRRLEKHISTHLEIRWKIAALELEGLVPVGPLLASVSFLKQLVVPSISVSVEINGRPYRGEGDVVAGIGEMQRMCVHMSCVASATVSSLPPGLPSTSSQQAAPVSFQGEMALRCFQDLQNGKPTVERMENLVVCGVQKRPFNLRMDASKPSSSSDPSFNSPSASNHTSFTYTFFFRTEGVYKLRPEVQARRNLQPIQADELFIPNVSFNVVTKLGTSSASLSSMAVSKRESTPS